MVESTIAQRAASVRITLPGMNAFGNDTSRLGAPSP